VYLRLVGFGRDDAERASGREHRGIGRASVRKRKIRCHHCHGSGLLSTFNGWRMVAVSCNFCGGWGFIYV
jgi:DnaJ-class molecular chaperone